MKNEIWKAVAIMLGVAGIMSTAAGIAWVSFLLGAGLEYVTLTDEMKRSANQEPDDVEEESEET